MTITHPGHPDLDRQDGIVRRLPLGGLDLESGQHLPRAVLAYETWGRLDPDGGNAVLVLHALTGDTHAARAPHRCGSEPDPGDAPGWWEGLIGPGAPLDTDRWFVVCPSILGGCSGSTGPADPAPDGRAWGSRFPRVGLRDTVQAELALADALGVDSWALVIGGSLGGCRALEWAVTAPERVKACAVIAAGPSATAEQVAWCRTQELAIRLDPAFLGGDYEATPGPREGLGLARRIAHITYRCPQELQDRFGGRAQPGEDPVGEAHAEGGPGRFAVEGYLDHQAEKLAERFDANSYLGVNAALRGHDVGRGRGGLAAALARTTCRWAVVGVDSDRLFPLEESLRLARHLPGAPAVRVVHSPHGHDGFLLETRQIGEVLAQTVLA